jgi:Ca2+-binding RTX toxin-like protein
MRGAFVVTALAGTLLWVGALGLSEASAATVAVDGDTVAVSGSDEVNAIEVGRDGAGRALISDGAGLTLGAGCAVSSFDSNTAVCGDSSTTVVAAALGGGADSFKMTDQFSPNGYTQVAVDGGAGDDRLGGAPTGVPNTLVGGSGDDSLFGGNFGDSLDGGDDNDTLMSDGGNDIVHGGNGNDTVNGSSGDDSVYGDAGNDNVSGDTDNDTVDGGSGQDVLNGDGNGPYPGNDTINAQDGERDTVGCDLGADVANVDAVDVVEGGGACEQVNVAPGGGGGALALKLTTPAKVGLRALLKKGVKFRVDINRRAAVVAALAVDRAAARKLGVGRKTTVLGAVSFTADAGAYRVTVKIKKRFRKKLAASHGFRLGVAVQAADADGTQRSRVKAVRVTR